MTIIVMSYHDLHHIVQDNYDRLTSYEKKVSDGNAQKALYIFCREGLKSISHSRMVTLNFATEDDVIMFKMKYLT